MSGFMEIFQSNFLLHNALMGSIVVGLFCPLIGVYFMLRRMVLMGVALPQISAAGISFVFFLQGLGFHWALHAGEVSDRFFALGGSLLFTLGAILLLAVFERQGMGTTESRIGALFAFAYAVSILLVSSNPLGKIEMLNMLHGEIVAINPKDLQILLVTFGALSLILGAFHNQFLLVSFDRESAQVMGKSVLLWDSLLYAFIGLTLSVSVLMVGPMLTFAFLIIPPLAARRWCRRMHSFFWLSSILGGLSGLIGFYASYQGDWPLGPTDILVASVILCLSYSIRKVITVCS
jgi:ABC-type Mn2+/Zn2+ transport system permease subunit